MWGGEPGRAAVRDGRVPGVKYQKALHRVRCHVGYEPSFLVFLLEYLAACKFMRRPPDLGGLLLPAGLGAVAACLHDVLEPTINPNHRGIVHGVALTGAALVG